MNIKAVNYQYPRNVWSRFLKVFQLIKAKDFYNAKRELDSVRYSDDVSEEIFDIYRRHLELAQAESNIVDKINIPADYLSHSSGLMTPPFRKLWATHNAPSPYPFHMTLPPFVGANNDTMFLNNAATRLAGIYSSTINKVHVVYSPGKSADIETIAAQVAALVFEGRIDITVFATPDMQATPATKKLGENRHLHIIEPDILDPKAQDHLVRIANDADLVVFLSGSPVLDDLALQRILPVAEVSDHGVYFFSQSPTSGQMQTPFSTTSLASKAGNRFPFREVSGLNFAVSASLLRRVGPIDTRFRSKCLAARELAFRMYNVGSYFLPVSLGSLSDFDDSRRFPKDIALFTALCPNHWDRKSDGSFENPKVSVYIPTYNASKYIERAVDSVLEQDVQDLELCLANDGSKDNTLELLQTLYKNEPRVRWVDNRNGGIGYASNQAIRMSNSLYIGQLDSDDCLKPGAVRRLMEHLDENPGTVCAYGSCERIDAAGNFTQDEYSWPVFSREKMMITSIAHHFRMFRRNAWERTTYFRNDIQNAVDYDIFLKLSELGQFHHIDEKLYQRRWHGENTSNVNEGHQTSNTYRVQEETLKRQGLLPFWEVHIPNPKEPRRVTYKLRDDKQMMLFWPDYSRNNPYQRLLYGQLRQDMEVIAGNIDAALKTIEQFKDDPSRVTFHLHWLNFVLLDITDPDQARIAVDDFVTKIEKFVWKGGKLIWTIHNTLSHDTPFPELEVELSTRIAAAADVLHFHSESSIDEVAEAFDFPREKVRISRHGSYIGAYPDYVPAEKSRAVLGIDDTDDVILFTGQIRPYKGVEQLVSVFRRILADRPNALLVLAGMQQFDPLESLKSKLSDFEKSRIRSTGKFVDDAELQLFFHAADMAVYPYQKILTSGSLLLALSYGTPPVIPEVGMTRETLADRDAGVLYEGDAGEEALEDAIRQLLVRKDKGELPVMKLNARQIAEELTWPDFGDIVV